MSQSEDTGTDGHQINEWRDRQGNLLGAAVYLSPDEVRQLQKTGSVELALDE